ncbi:sensor histidine kinase [Nonomuraea gerenzanensis]|uniref:histidine kinase n=1 Tax=Nonomuraea gerenzanensis TaxID=93944 RepID=A0A1M4EG92_9ACTN|nr:histidine kinase [Nonomuraea gerenzanensis]UBU09277.1 histidine kinase [Nonomuraea gerenzanensis]SBO97678.1 two-component system sensor kinase [Nonomuraea gerenzanensis]
MPYRPATQQLQGRWGTALPYVCAVLPMLFHTAVIGGVVSQAHDRLPQAVLDVGLGVLGLVLLGWRRRWPWQIALVTTLLSGVSSVAGGPAYVAYVSLCAHRRWRQIVPVAAVHLAGLVAYSTLPAATEASDVAITTGTVVLGALTVVGLYHRGRQDLAASQREAARLAHRQQAQLIEQAKLAERLKIAHEMHDVLAHRISLLSMLAGGLAYRKDLTGEEAREAALAIQENAHQSLDELRAVLGMLRRDGCGGGGGAGGGEVESPQPDLSRLNALFAEVRAVGQHVEAEETITARELLPSQTGRHAYRIVQEALTNARKHAPGSPVRAEISGRPGAELRIRVSNEVLAGAPAGSGGRLGLVGLAERIRMAGGMIAHGVRDGRFVLDAWLPWEPSQRAPTADSAAADIDTPLTTVTEAAI